MMIGIFTKSDFELKTSKVILQKTKKKATFQHGIKFQTHSKTKYHD